MDELLHVDGLILLALSIEALPKVDPAQASRAMQRAPTVKNIDLTTAKVDKEFLETPKDIVGLLCIEASRHDHVASNQEDNFELCIHAGACREDELVVCVPSCDLICHFMELVDVDQRTWHATLCPYINIIVACQC